jgi:hypothetical protein
MEVQRPFGDTRLIARTVGGIAHETTSMPVQELVYLGGPVTAPGYEYHSLVGTAAVSQRVELQLPVPFVSVSLGRFGRSAARATFAPFVTAVGLKPAEPVTTGGPLPPDVLARLSGRTSGVYPSAGAGLLLFFDMLRLDVARGLRDGRWTLSLDLNRAFWPVL